MRAQPPVGEGAVVVAAAHAETVAGPVEAEQRHDHQVEVAAHAPATDGVAAEHAQAHQLGTRDGLGRGRVDRLHVLAIDDDFVDGEAVAGRRLHRLDATVALGA